MFYYMHATKETSCSLDSKKVTRTHDIQSTYSTHTTSNTMNSHASRVSSELGEEVGKGGQVGYQIAMHKEGTGASTKLMFVTTGILLRKLIHRQQHFPYTHVILDEGMT